MSAQFVRVHRTNIVEPVSGVHRASLFVVFLVCSLAINFFGSQYFAIFPTNKNLAYTALLSLLFFGAALWLRRDERLSQYWHVAFAFFTAAGAISLTLLLGDRSGTVTGWFGLAYGTSPFTAIAKVYEMLMMAVPILVLTKLSGADLGAIYLKRGYLKWELSIGLLVFFNFAGSAFLFFAARYTSLDTLGAALVWGLVFSAANGFMEELWLRGIFLRRFEPVIGLGGSVLLTSIAFALLHAGSGYYMPPVAIPFYVANTFTLGLACGYLTMKTDSIWGATLIHAASDLFLFIAVLANA